MRLYHFIFLIITCITYFAPLSTKAEMVGILATSPLNTSNQGSSTLDTSAQASSTLDKNQSTLRNGSEGPSVTALQNQLKQLGYYKDVVDGKYGESTRAAVAEFQKAKKLDADGVAGATTLNRIREAQVSKLTPLATTSLTPQKPAAKPSKGQNLLWWALVLLGGLGVTGAVLYVVRRLRKPSEVNSSVQYFATNLDNQQNQDSEDQKHNSHLNSNNGSPLNHLETGETQPTSTVLPIEQTTRLAKINIVDELMQELHSSDLSKRRKAIWDLGQQGDSRAVQPLVELMLDSDSQQRSLILAALAEIGTRTLKPMNRALAVSLQDENAEVRKNAIRDLTRIYDIMAQISQLLCHAVEDTDAEVQETARYALSKMNRIRAIGAEGEQGRD